MKLKAPKLDWKAKVEKLRRIVLSGVAIEELPPGMLAAFDAWRAHTHGKITDEACMQAIAAVQNGAPPEPLMWEPYSDGRGDPESLYGWQIQATMFGIGGQAWWLVKAHRENAAEPTEQQLQMIRKAIELLGCHDTRKDLIREFPDEQHRRTMFWSWFHTGPLLEMHFSKSRGVLIVNEGTPTKGDYERMDRISRKVQKRSVQ